MGPRLKNAGFYLLMVVLLILGSLALLYEMTALGVWLIFSGVLGCGWSVGDSLWEKRNEEIICRTRLIGKRMAFGMAAAQWDQETRYFLAREWPQMGVEFGESQIAYILEGGVNTGVLISFLQAFLMDSNEVSFVDLRKYNDEKYLQERFNVSREAVRQQWRLATEFLVRKNFLAEGSMAGNRTYQWTSKDHYEVMRRRYLNLRPIPEME